MRHVPELLALVLGASACFPSNVVAPTERRVASPLERVAWRPATAADLPGSWSSEEITGPMAAVLSELHYVFRPDGTYTGAALIGAERPSYQVLTGTWVLEGDTLRLDDAAPGRIEASEERLRLSGDEGVVVLLRRGER